MTGTWSKRVKMKVAISHRENKKKKPSISLLLNSLVPSFISYPQDSLMNETDIPKGSSEILQQKLNGENDKLRIPHSF